MQKVYFERLKAKVLPLSHSQVWKEAKKEWWICGYIADEECGGVCQCTKERLCHLYTIQNKITRHKLWYIGSKCINHFDNKRMTDTKNHVEKTNQMGKRKVQFGQYADKTFQEVPQSYIAYLRTLRRLPYEKYRQLIMYDDMRKESIQILKSPGPSFYD
jgi:hypothetical protein